MTSDIDVNIEPLPGYRLIEHIGAGGYGEVWRAEAPGGLTKAIKFIYGQHHEKRAANELRALERVRAVRHPFLLSLERIEVVDGRLLVVTELADGSVKDRFDMCRLEGLAGIPRNELMVYLRDAADALDFMSDAHTLQHLDIKPENLLLLSGRVKVADFGLVKDVRHSETSLVGGMTPMYAAPEVFRGTPSGRSDQYSLAIVFQEMLTGTLPFAGGSAAELTLQHLNDEPDLSPLSVGDRYVVSRALAKDPQHRYATCRDFVDALFKATACESSPEAPTQPDKPFGESSPFGGPGPRENPPTALFDDESDCWTTVPKQLLIELPPADGDLVDLPPINHSECDPRPVPTVVLGIGGAAGRVLAHLRRVVHHESGAAAALPAVQFLLLDTDPRALADVTGRDGSKLLPEETLALPLRRPQHYREHSQQLLHWLSRRWLYNIPRSLRTEGLRPLGRLALAEHARQTCQQIFRAVSQALAPESLAASRDTFGQEFRDDTLRVFVVASISGGTGGGMALDVGYAVRAVLEKLNLRDAKVTGLMMHSTGSEPRYSELARVNSFAWLSEFQHFRQPENAYPGDASCGLPAHEAGTCAFDHTYLIHLGEHLNSTEFDQATQSVAEYLRLSVFTPAASRLHEFREDANSTGVHTPGDRTATLRSFGLYRRTAAPNELCDEFAALVSKQVLAGWRSSDSATPISPLLITTAGLEPGRVDVSEACQAATGAAQLMQRLQLDSTGIAANARSLVELQLGGDAATFLAAWFAKQTSTREAAEQVQLQAIDRIFGASENQRVEGRKIFLLGQPVSVIIQPLEEKLRNEIRRWVLSRIDDPRERIGGARRALRWINAHFHEAEGELQRLRRSVIAKIEEIHAEARNFQAATSGQSGDTLPHQVLDYFRLRLDQLAISAAERAVHLILSDAKAMSDELTTLGREIDQLAAAECRGANSAMNPDAGKSRSEAHERLATAMRAKLPELAAEVDGRLQTEYLQQHGGLLKTVVQGGSPRARLSAKLQELSQQAVYRATADADVLQTMTSEAAAQRHSDLRSGLAAATPALLEFGGTRRVLAILPRDAADECERASISQALGTEVTTACGSDNSLTLCVEADHLSLPHIAVELIQHRRDRVEFAQRVHCRTDIAWTPLISTGATNQTRSSEHMCKTVVM